MSENKENIGARAVKRRLDIGTNRGNRLALGSVNGVQRQAANKATERITAHFTVAKRVCVDKQTLPVFAFDHLPDSVALRFYDTCCEETLGKIAQTSRKQLAQVTRYLLYTEAGMQRLVTAANMLPESSLPAEKKEEAVRSRMRTMGTLLKRITMLMPTTQRVHCIVDVFHKIAPPSLALMPLHQAGWGALMKAVVSGWEFHELVRVYRRVMQLGDVDAGLQELVQEGYVVGSNPYMEYRLHVLFRKVFVEGTSRPEIISFFVSKILSNYSAGVKARLLYMLAFSVPEAAERWNLDWNAMLDQSAVLSHGVVRGVSRLISVLLSANPRYVTLDHLLAIIEHMISASPGWLIDNFACLLLFCDESVALSLLKRRLAGRAEQRNPDEAADVLMTMWQLRRQLTLKPEDEDRVRNLFRRVVLMMKAAQIEHANCNNCATLKPKPVTVKEMFEKITQRHNADVKEIFQMNGGGNNELLDLQLASFEDLVMFWGERWFE